MNKKGFGFEIAKDLIILIVVTGFLVYLAVLVMGVVDSQSKVGICGVSAVVTDFSGDTSGGISKAKWYCPIDGPIEITLDDLNSEPASWLPDATKNAYSYTVDGKKTGKMETLEKDSRELAEYNLDKILADKIKDCYLKTGFSRAELFSNWYDFIGLKENAVTNETFFTRVNPLNYEYKYPVGCGICSTLYVDDDAMEKYFSQTIAVDSLATYMANHPHIASSTVSYLDYTELRGNGIFGPDLSYTVGGVENQMYVVIQRHEIHQALKWFDTVDTAIKWGVNFVSGADVSTVYGDDGPEAYVTFKVLRGSDLNSQCAFIANEFEEE